MGFAQHRNIVLLTGAGISKSAGLPTYRGPGGLWNNPANVELNTVEAFRERRAGKGMRHSEAHRFGQTSPVPDFAQLPGPEQVPEDDDGRQPDADRSFG